MPILTLVSVRGIHDYAYRGVSRLRQTIGASRIIAESLQALNQYNSHFEYEGGGNAALIFPDLDRAKQTIFEWSKGQRSKAPGLGFTVVHHPFSDGQLAAEFKSAIRALAQAGGRPAFGAPLGALPVHRRCSYTGQAAQYSDGESYLSDEAQCKHEKGVYQPHPEYFLPVDLDQLGGRSGESHIAVVHPDGNEVGALIERVLESCAGLSDRQLMDRLREVSEWIRESTQAATNTLLGQLSALRPALVSRRIVDPPSGLGPEEAEKWLPFRMFIEEGDEAGFVIHGRLAISATAQWLRLIERHSSELRRNREFLPECLTASAGLTIVPRKFPFSRAFSHAQELAKLAKRARLAWTKDKPAGTDASYLDFEILREGSSGAIAQMRTDQGVSRNPYRVEPDRSLPELDSFQALERRLEEIETWPRSVAKRFLEALAAGQPGRFLDEQRGRKRELADTAGSYRDPLDALDFHLRIDWDGCQILSPERETEER